MVEVVEYLPSKSEALRSNPSTDKKSEKTTQRLGKVLSNNITGKGLCRLY
jgi:hypothetical protein